jgi:hypothetical protein
MAEVSSELHASLFENSAVTSATKKTPKKAACKGEGGSSEQGRGAAGGTRRMWHVRASRTNRMLRVQASRTNRMRRVRASRTNRMRRVRASRTNRMQQAWATLAETPLRAGEQGGGGVRVATGQHRHDPPGVRRRRKVPIPHRARRRPHLSRPVSTGRGRAASGPYPGQ